MRAPLVFIHGWGFNSSVWRETAARLPDRTLSFIDLGFMGKPAVTRLEVPDNAIIVAHSLGVLWALKNLSKQPAAFVSICGFDRFSPPVSSSALELMKRGLTRNPMAQMTHFWRSCGIDAFADEQQLDQSALTEGLDWLKNWDCRTERQSLSCPVHVLAVREDEIVPEQMSCDIWGDSNIHWAQSGGHALPLTRADWCADQIRQFAQSNE